MTAWCFISRRRGLDVIPHRAPCSLSVALPDQIEHFTVFAQHGGAAIPGLEVNEMAHQNALVVRSIFKRANRLHEMPVGRGGSNGFVKEIVEVMGNGAGGMRFFKFAQGHLNAVHIGETAPASRQECGFRLHHQAELEIIQHALGLKKKRARGLQ
jgi:hypothetical protein